MEEKYLFVYIFIQILLFKMKKKIIEWLALILLKHLNIINVFHRSVIFYISTILLLIYFYYYQDKCRLYYWQ